MISHIDRRQTRAEVSRIEANRARIGLSGPEIITPDEDVRTQPEGLYRPPEYLNRTAPAAMVVELAELLHELWTVNQDCVGEKILEMQAFYTATGQHLELQGRFLNWCDRYFSMRADRNRLTPQVHSDPFVLANSVTIEAVKLLKPLHDRFHTMNTTYLQLSLNYVPWRLYKLLWEGLVWVDDCNDVWVGYKPARPVLLSFLANVMIEAGWERNHLPAFLQLASDAIGSTESLTSKDTTAAELRARIAARAADIQIMRPLLVRNYRPEKSTVTVDGRIAVAWSWRVGEGIGYLVVDESLTGIQRQLISHCWKHPIGVGHDGLFFDVRTPWLTTDRVATDVSQGLIANLFVLDQIHAKLLTLYDQIDLGRVLAGKHGRITGGTSSLGPRENVVAAGCQLLAEAATVQQAETLPKDGQPVRKLLGLRLERLLRVLESRFSCEVRSGKGSEVCVYREGGRTFTLGRHKRNGEVHPAVVRKLLCRVGIGSDEWERVVSC